MAGILIHDVSGYPGEEYNLKIPSLTDTANIQEAMMLFHYGIDNYDGTGEPAAQSVFGNLKDFDDRIASLEESEVIALTGTANQITASGSVGSVTVSLPNSIITPGTLNTTSHLSVGGSASFTGNVSLSGNQSTSGSAAIVGNTTVGQSLTVGQAAIFASSASVMSTLRVNGATTLDSTLGVGTDLLVSGSASIPTLSSTTASVTTDYVTTSNITTANITTANFSGVATFNEITEATNDLSLTSNSASPNFDNGEIFYISASPTANFSLDFQNVPTTNDRVTTFTFFVTQGATGYIPSSVLIGGASQTLKWVGAVAPTPTSDAGKIDIFTFTLIRRSDAWSVFGNANLGF